MAELDIDFEGAMMVALQKAIELLIDRYDELGMRASGNWARELEARVENNIGYIYGAAYSEYLTKGRPPGRPPPVTAIYRWMLEKRTFSGPKTMSRAFAIANTIAKEGTSWYQKGGSDLLEILESSEVLNAFIESLGQEITRRIANNLTRTIREELE